MTLPTLAQGMPYPCTSCGESGRITAIHADRWQVRDVFATCDDCAAEYAARFPDETDALQPLPERATLRP